jgi:hypothetical protein
MQKNMFCKVAKARHSYRLGAGLARSGLPSISTVIPGRAPARSRKSRSIISGFRVHRHRAALRAAVAMPRNDGA